MHETGQSTKLFNTAIIATKISKGPEASGTSCAGRLNNLLKSPAFSFIIKAIRDYSKEVGVSEEQAAEVIVKTFRDIDSVWNDYIFQEGLDRLRTQLVGKKDN